MRCRSPGSTARALRTYRHAPNTGSRKSWAAGDATVARRAPRADREDRRDGLSVGADREDLGLLRRAVQGPAVHVPAPVRQLRDGERAVQDHLPRRVPRADRGRMRDAAASAGAADRLDDIATITIRTHESAIRIIDKKGPLDNPADRDHCIQYMVAVPLIFGRLTAADYEDDVAADPRIDALREKMACVEDPQFTKDYLDPEKRSIANALTVEFNDGTERPRSRRRVPDRPPAPPRRRHSAADREVQDQPRAPLSGEAAAGDPRRRARSRRGSQPCRCTSSSI